MKRLIRFPQYPESIVNSRHTTGFVSKKAVRTQPDLIKVSEFFQYVRQIKPMETKVSAFLRTIEECTSHFKSSATRSERKNSLEASGYSFEIGV